MVTDRVTTRWLTEVARVLRPEDRCPARMSSKRFDWRTPCRTRWPVGEWATQAPVRHRRIEVAVDQISQRG
jgi:hypothetical protein